MDRLLSGSGNTVPWLSALPVFCSRAAHFTEHSLVTDIDSEGLACGYLSSARSKMEVSKTSTLIMGSGPRLILGSHWDILTMACLCAPLSKVAIMGLRPFWRSTLVFFCYWGTSIQE